jgi:hypothetical protein
MVTLLEQMKQAYASGAKSPTQAFKQIIVQETKPATSTSSGKVKISTPLVKIISSTQAGKSMIAGAVETGKIEIVEPVKTTSSAPSQFTSQISSSITERSMVLVGPGTVPEKIMYFKKEGPLPQKTYTQQEWLQRTYTSMEQYSGAIQGLKGVIASIDTNKEYYIDASKRSWAKGEWFIPRLKEQLGKLEAGYAESQMTVGYARNIPYGATITRKGYGGYQVNIPYYETEEYKALVSQDIWGRIATGITTALTPEDPLGLKTIAYAAMGQPEKIMETKVQSLQRVNYIKETGGLSGLWWYLESPVTQLGMVLTGTHYISAYVASKAAVAAATGEMIHGSIVAKLVGSAVIGVGVGVSAVNVQRSLETKDVGQISSTLGMLGFTIAAGYAGWQSGAKAGLVAAEPKIQKYFTEHPEQLRFYQYRVGEKLGYDVSAQVDVASGMPMEKIRGTVMLRETYVPGKDVIATTSKYTTGVQQLVSIRSVGVTPNLETTMGGDLVSKLGLSMKTVGKMVLDVPSYGGIERSTMYSVAGYKSGLPLGGLLRSLEVPITTMASETGMVFFPVSSFVSKSIIGAILTSSVIGASVVEIFKPRFVTPVLESVGVVQKPRFDALRVFEPVYKPRFDVGQVYHPVFNIGSVQDVASVTSTVFEPVFEPKFEFKTVYEPVLDFVSVQESVFALRTDLVSPMITIPVIPWIPGLTGTGVPGGGGGWGGRRVRKKGARKRVHPITLYRGIFGG